MKVNTLDYTTGEVCYNNQYCNSKGIQTYIELVHFYYSHIKIYKRNLTEFSLL